MRVLFRYKASRNLAPVSIAEASPINSRNPRDTHSGMVPAPQAGAVGRDCNQDIPLVHGVVVIQSAWTTPAAIPISGATE